MLKVSLYEPKGFLAAEDTRPYDNNRVRKSVISIPSLAFVPDFSKESRNLHSLFISLTEGEPLALINDNDNEYYNFSSYNKKIYTLNDNLYKRKIKELNNIENKIDHEKKNAIGTIFNNDVLSFYFDLSKIENPELVLAFETDDSIFSTSKSAVISFTEFLKRAFARELDVNPNEFISGIQPHDVNNVSSYKMFICDALENGAGYVRQFHNEDFLKRSIENLYRNVVGQWSDPEHSKYCDSSCPNCIRNYSNRSEHHSLDWRLALDLVEIVLYNTIRNNRWEKIIENASKHICDLANETKGYPDIEKETSDNYSFITNRKNTIVVDHPLYAKKRDGQLSKRQLDFRDKLRASTSIDQNIEFVDARDVDKNPFKQLVKLDNQ